MVCLKKWSRLKPLVQKVFIFLFLATLLFPQFSTFFSTPAHAISPAWYNSSWRYRKPITVDNSSNASVLTNYQVKVSLTSSNFDFSKAQSTGADIRFTDNDGTTILNHWIESYDRSGQTAIVWVKVPSIPASSTKTIYFYYGNDSTTATSNLSNTFGNFTYSDFFGQTKTISGSSSYEAFSGAVRLQNGDILVAFREGISHSGQDGKINLARSTDNGETWTTVTVYDDPLYDDRIEIGLTQLSNGTILLPFRKYDAVLAKVLDNYLLKSTDNGSSWSDPILMANPLSNWLARYGKIMELADGTLLAPAYGVNTGENSRSVLMQSTDGGNTWSLKSTIVYSPSLSYNETSVLQLDTNNFFSVIRAATTPIKLYSSISNDGGNIWSTPQELFPGISPCLVKLANGHILLTYAARTTDTGLGTGSFPFGIYAAVSTDNGTTWTSKIPLYYSQIDSVYNALGYPNSIQLPSGNIFTSFNATGNLADVFSITWSEKTDGVFADDLEGQDTTKYTFRGTGSQISSETAHNSSYSINIYDQDSTKVNRVGTTLYYAPQTTGSISFWIYPDTVINGAHLALLDGSNRRFLLSISSDGSLKYYNNSYQEGELPVQTDVVLKTWTKISLNFNHTNNQAEVFVNDQSKGIISHYQSGLAINSIEFASVSSSGLGDKFYIDDIYPRGFTSTEPSTSAGTEEFDNTPPSLASFYLESPKDNVSITDTDKPTFRFHKATDDISGISSYQIILDRGDGKGEYTYLDNINPDPVNNNERIEENMNIKYSTFFLEVTAKNTSSKSYGLSNGSYSWKVRATDNVGLSRDAGPEYFKMAVSSPDSPSSSSSPSLISTLFSPLKSSTNLLKPKEEKKEDPNLEPKIIEEGPSITPTSTPEQTEPKAISKMPSWLLPLAIITLFFLSIPLLAFLLRSKNANRIWRSRNK